MSDSPTGPVESQQSSRSTSTEMVSVTDVGALMRRYRVRFAILAAAIVIAVTTVGLLTTSRQPYYEAQALVIATELEIRIESLPRTAVAIFNAPTVAARAVEIAGTGLDPDDLIPQIAQVNPLENTGVLEVNAQHPDPELAALYANAAGRALAEELNLVGPGLGTFSLQIPASVPDKAVEPSIVPILAISLVAAAVLVVGVAALAAMFTRGRGDSVPVPASPVSTPTPRPASSPKVGLAVPERRPERVRPAADGNRAQETGSTPQKKEKKQPKPGEDDIGELKVDELEPFVHHLDRIPRPAPIHPLASSAEQATALMESISGVGPVFAARLAALGITKVSELAAADPKWVADAVEVRREVVIDWIRQAIGLHSELHYDTDDDIEADDG